MVTAQKFKCQLIALSVYVIRGLSRRREYVAPAVYLAFSIGPEVLAIAVCELDVKSDKDALAKATPLLHDGLRRIEIWCGSRKVGDILPRSGEDFDKEPDATPSAKRMDGGASLANLQVPCLMDADQLSKGDVRTLDRGSEGRPGF
jgi:hypothetical protein